MVNAMKTKGNRRGTALVVVLCMTGPAMMAVAMMASLAGSYALRARGTARMEKAFYIAEGGAEHAVQHIAEGGAVPTTLTGTLGEGNYLVVILVENPAGGNSTASGTIRINPNNSPQASFFATLPDGTHITRQHLLEGFDGYNGPATRVHFRPMGGGNQSGLSIDGASYTIQNNTVYDINSPNMTIRVFNDHPVKAMGHWRLEINASNAVFTDGSLPGSSSRYTRYQILSEGTVGNISRRVSIDGLHAISWARFALWYHSEALQLWMVGGETFHGPVHANTEFRFHSHQVASHGQTRFFDRVSSTASSYQRLNNSVNPVFDRGIALGAAAQDTTSINFTELHNDADLVLQGMSTITLDGTNMVVSNSRMGWNNAIQPLPTDGMIYVRTATTGASATRPGDVILAAPDGLQGRLTIVAERDIQITDHVRYRDNPVTNPISSDALGLISQRHVTVQTGAPSNLDVYAHIIAVDGGFGVVNYDSAALGPRGTLTVYGGIVNRTRQAVGSTGGTGYNKNYMYDQRFQADPPPGYPVVPNAYQWTGWRDD